MSQFHPRAAARKRCYLKARFAFNNGCSTLDAILRDISSAGARAACDDMRLVPAEFDLFISGFGGATSKRRARRIWSDNGAMGIAFLS